ncbi:MAG: SulP family inorganic anion transporter [Candidatus Babeliales bacterium]|jgi:SulP family sulfate permease
MMKHFRFYSSRLLQLNQFKQNITAGIIIGIIALPLSMAFAIASGATPASGIYTAIIAAIIVGIFGGTQVQIAGPTGAFVAILSTITAQHGFIGLQLATLMAGIIMILMGLFKLGKVVKFIPYPVIVGFTTGIGFIIFVGQWKSFFGLPVHISTQAHFHEKFVLLLQHIPSLHVATTILSCTSLCTYLITKRYFKKIPAPLTTLISATVLNLLFGNNSIETIGSAFGAIPQQIPTWSIPMFSTVDWTQLIGPACTIALLGAIESLLSASAVDAILNTKHNSNQELIGEGLANIVTPFFGGFASTGAIARTITSIRNGGSNPIAAITHSIVLLFILLSCAPHASYIPLCALATILFIVAYGMSDLHQFIHIAHHAPWYDAAVLIITCLLTIVIDLVIAVAFGCIIATLFTLIRLYQTTTSRHPYVFATLWKTSVTNVTSTTCENNTVEFIIEGPFFFGVAEKLEQAFSVTNTDPTCIIFNFKNVPFIDITGLTVFYKTVQDYHQRGVKVYIKLANERIIQKFKKMGIDTFVHYF